jgi:polyhydroxyalkanoate synthesis regulator phasin
MHMPPVLRTILLLLLSVILIVAPARARGVLDILREKGILSEEEYKQAIEEVQDQEKKARQEIAEKGKKESTLPDWLSRISLFGDLRYRHEGFYNSTITTNSPDRNRERIRARFGLGVDVTEEVQGKLRIVSGDPNDPISTNQTLTDLFTRKPISLEWAYITVSPWKTLGLDKLTGLAKPLFLYHPWQVSPPHICAGWL